MKCAQKKCRGITFITSLHSKKCNLDWYYTSVASTVKKSAFVFKYSAGYTLF